MKKVVLHLINSNSFSGLENVACDIIHNSSDKFNHIYVTRKGTIIEVLKENNISYEIIEKMSIKEIKRVIKKYNANLVHAHDYTASCISALARIDIPIISHLHNNGPWIKTLHPYSFLYLYCSRRFKKILTVSAAIEKEYIFSKFIKNKIKCIGNPVSVSKILSKVTKEDYQKKYDICCVGRLTQPKNPFKFLDVINELKKSFQSLKVIWVGDGELREEVISKMKELNLKDTIELVGFQKNPYKFMASSKIFLLTSDWEGYGLVAFEALTLGLPCVVSNVGGLPEIVDDTCGFLCNTRDDYVVSIINVLKNNAIFNELSKQAVLKSKNIDNSDTYYNEICKLYKRYV